MYSFFAQFRQLSKCFQSITPFSISSTSLGVGLGVRMGRPGLSMVARCPLATGLPVIDMGG